MLMASARETTPSWAPSTPMTRTSRARILPLTLTNEPAKGEERGEKGRLKAPSRVEAYSCGNGYQKLSVIDVCIYSSTLHFVQVKYRIKSALFPAALLGVPSSARL